MELNIILPRVNHFDIKQRKAWNIRFIICRQHQTRCWKIKVNKTQQFRLKLKFFRKNRTITYLTITPGKTFYIIFCWYFFLKSLAHEKINRIRIFLTRNRQLIWDWLEIKQENMILIYDVTISHVTIVSSYFT